MTARPVLLAALVAVLGYAAFAAGAARQPGRAWFEVLVAVVALGAAASALLGPGPRWRVGRRAAAGVVLLALFAAWTGVTLLWSIDPDGTWGELNRALAYAAVAAVAVWLGATLPRAVEGFAVGWLVVASVVALYALGGKVAPGVHVGGLLDLDQTAQVSRLRAPLEYWNALALLCALAAPVAVRLATDAARRPAARLAALEALALLAVVIGLTYSRGGVAAFVVAAAVLTVAGGARLRGLVVLALATLAATGPLAFAFASDALTTNGAPLGARIHDGRILGAIALASALALWAVSAWLLRRERTLAWSPERSTRVFRAGGAVAAAVVLGLAAALAASQHGLGGSVRQAVRGFTEIKQDRQYDPVRLLSTNSGNRYVWWQEAVGAWSDRPIAGWGGGTFARLHLRYRTEPLPVTEAHSVPLQVLAETGVVGLVLLYGGLLALLAGAISRVRSLRGGRERDLSVALLAGAVAWLVHAFYDWDFTIPAVTAPMLVMLGLVAGAAARTRPSTTRKGSDPQPSLRPEPAVGPRAGVFALVAIGLITVIVSAGLPALSAARADEAAAQAAGGSPRELQAAAATADLGARLDPLATRPLFVAAAIAQARGRLLEARHDLLEAADRDPDDPDAWSRLVLLAVRLADREGAQRAAMRFAQLDPLNPGVPGLVGRVNAGLAPAAGSATATGTPLAAGAPAPAP